MFRRSKKGAQSERNLRGEAPRRELEAHRAASAPLMSRSRVKGILKFRTKEESWAATYGASSDSENGKSGIKFHIIEIREYERTVGDNPSCSSGPPIS